MVALETDQNTGLPDPDNPSNSDLMISNEDVILFGVDDDDDEELDDIETSPFDQYQPLPVEESLDSNSESSDEESQNNAISSAPADIPPIVPIESTLVKEVWSCEPPKCSDIEMNSQKVDEVKQAMAGITLPSTSIPDWASKIPEEHWKQELMERIEQMKKAG